MISNRIAVLLTLLSKRGVQGTAINGKQIAAVISPHGTYTVYPTRNLGTVRRISDDQRQPTKPPGSFRTFQVEIIVTIDVIGRVIYRRRCLTCSFLDSTPIRAR